jgi:hypothetical protein
MIGQTISHDNILEKLGEAQRRSKIRSFVERGKPARRNLSIRMDKQ